MTRVKYRIRIPAEFRKGEYFTRRPVPKQIKTAYYEMHVETLSDLTKEEWFALLDKWATIGGLGNLRVTKIEVYEDSEESKEG